MGREMGIHLSRDPGKYITPLRHVGAKSRRVQESNGTRSVRYEHLDPGLEELSVEWFRIDVEVQRIVQTWVSRPLNWRGN